MNFAIPREDLSEMVLYIWKIIGYPQIPLDDIIFKICFELLLFSPYDAKKFVESAVKAKYLTRNPNNSIELSNTLEKKLNLWNQKQKDSIIYKAQSLKSQERTRTEFIEENMNHFNILLKALLDKGTINRAAALSNDAFEIIKFNPKESEIIAKVKGSKEQVYNIIININKKVLSHNCHDFETKRAQNYKFCKHLARLFLILKKRDEAWTNQVLEKITKNIENWTFTV
ncbi:MAG: hypothetical protein ACFFKA_10055 [Candidatus Thorarchaeota archaeon]